MYPLARLRLRLRLRLLLASQRLLSFAFANRRHWPSILSCVWISAGCVCAQSLHFALANLRLHCVCEGCLAQNLRLLELHLHSLRFCVCVWRCAKVRIIDAGAELDLVLSALSPRRGIACFAGCWLTACLPSGGRLPVLSDPLRCFHGSRLLAHAVPSMSLECSGPRRQARLFIVGGEKCRHPKAY